MWPAFIDSLVPGLFEPTRKFFTAFVEALPPECSLNLYQANMNSLHLEMIWRFKALLPLGDELFESQREAYASWEGVSPAFMIGRAKTLVALAPDDFEGIVLILQRAMQQIQILVLRHELLRRYMLDGVGHFASELWLASKVRRMRADLRGDETIARELARAMGDSNVDIFRDFVRRHGATS